LSPSYLVGVSLHPPEDLSGRVFDRLTVLRRAENSAKYFKYWLCRCSCPAATEKAIRSDALLNKRTRSCGCLAKEVAHMRSGSKHPSFRHGHSKRKQMSPEFHSWRGMIYRCSPKNKTDYSNYFGRGITVCDRWRGKGGFENFLADVGLRPEGTSIDRWPNKDGNYEPGNCRWATAKQQNNNRRKRRTGYRRLSKAARNKLEQASALATATAPQVSEPTVMQVSA